jgi:hypothetical protein
MIKSPCTEQNDRQGQKPNDGLRSKLGMVFLSIIDNNTDSQIPVDILGHQYITSYGNEEKMIPVL